MYCGRLQTACDWRIFFFFSGGGGGDLFTKSCLTQCNSTDGSPPVQVILCPWDFSGKNIGVGCHLFLKGIFPTQGLNQYLLNYRQICANSIGQYISIKQNVMNLWTHSNLIVIFHIGNVILLKERTRQNNSHRLAQDFGKNNFLSSDSFQYSHCCCCSVTKFYPTFCDAMDHSTPGFPVHHHLPEFAQIRVHWVSDAI